MAQRRRKAAQTMPADGRTPEPNAHRIFYALCDVASEDLPRALLEERREDLLPEARTRLGPAPEHPPAWPEVLDRLGGFTEEFFEIMMEGKSPKERGATQRLLTWYAFPELRGNERRVKKWEAERTQILKSLASDRLNSELWYASLGRAADSPPVREEIDTALMLGLEALCDAADHPKIAPSVTTYAPLFAPRLYFYVDDSREYSGITRLDLEATRIGSPHAALQGFSGVYGAGLTDEQRFATALYVTGLATGVVHDMDEWGLAPANRHKDRMPEPIYIAPTTRLSDDAFGIG